jgi:hypothetical protein
MLQVGLRTPTCWSFFSPGFKTLNLSPSPYQTKSLPMDNTIKTCQILLNFLFHVVKLQESSWLNLMAKFNV